MILKKHTNRAATSFIIVCTMVIIFFIALFSAKAYAVEAIKRNILDYLDENQVEYTSAEINDSVLTINLISKGDKRCTIEDAKAMQTIYEAVHKQETSEKVKDVQINIYNNKNNIIYNYFEKDVSSPIEVGDLSNEIKLSKKGDDFLTQVQNTLDARKYSVKEIFVTSADGIKGNKVELTLFKSANEMLMQDLKSVYDDLEIYALSSDTVTQCEITVLDEKDECYIYMAGDLEYGNCVTWISPEYESSFIAQEGPKQQ